MINDKFQAIRESFDLQYEIQKYGVRQDWKLIRHGFKNKKSLSMLMTDVDKKNSVL